MNSFTNYKFKIKSTNKTFIKIILDLCYLLLNKTCSQQSSTEITQYNLNEIFHEILHKSPYDPLNPPPEEEDDEEEEEEEMDHDGDTDDEDSEDEDCEEPFVYPEDNIRDEYGLCASTLINLKEYLFKFN